MAPKRQRKSTELRGKQPVTITGSSVPYASNTFVNEEAEMKHATTIKERPLLFECPLEINDELMELLMQQLGSRGWGFLLEPPSEVNPSMVKEFYSNYINQNMESIFLRGQEVPITEAAIAAALHIPVIRGKDSYEKMVGRRATTKWNEVLDTIAYHGAVWETGANSTPIGVQGKYLNLEARLWQQVLFSHVVPCRHETLLTFEQVCLIFCVLQGKQVNLTRLILKTMSAVHHKRRTDGLPYPSLITRMARAAGCVDRQGDEAPNYAFRRPITTAQLMKRDRMARKAAAETTSCPNPFTSIINLLKRIRDEARRDRRRMEYRLTRLEARMDGAEVPPLEPPSEEEFDDDDIAEEELMEDDLGSEEDSD